MTQSRSLLFALAATAVLMGARPMAGDDQFPRGLMSSSPLGSGQGGRCRIDTRPLSFGAYDPLAEVDVDAVGQVIYFCDGNGGGGGGRGGPPDGRGGGPGTRSQYVGLRIELDEGSNRSFDPRAMIGPGGQVLDYNIYLDATRRTIWGTGVGSTEVYIDLNPPTGTPVVVPMYGRIFGRQSDDVAAGSYQDIVSVRIQF